MADIVIAPFTVGKGCEAARVVVDRRMLKAEGAHALYIEGLSIRTETVAAARGQRPWCSRPRHRRNGASAIPWTGMTLGDADDEAAASGRR